MKFRLNGERNKTKVPQKKKKKKKKENFFRRY